MYIAMTMHRSPADVDTLESRRLTRSRANESKATASKVLEAFTNDGVETTLVDGNSAVLKKTARSTSKPYVEINIKTVRASRKPYVEFYKDEGDATGTPARMLPLARGVSRRPE